MSTFSKSCLKALFTSLLAFASTYTFAATTKKDEVETTTCLTIEVDYDADLDTLIKACGFTSHDKSINAKNFPSLSKGTSKREFRVFHFTRKLSPNEAAAELKKHGFRTTQVIELVTFLLKNKKGWVDGISAFGQEYRRLVVGLGIMGNNRRLTFASARSKWSANVPVLGIRISE